MAPLRLLGVLRHFFELPLTSASQRLGFAALRTGWASKAAAVDLTQPDAVGVSDTVVIVWSIQAGKHPKAHLERMQ